MTRKNLFLIAASVSLVLIGCSVIWLEKSRSSLESRIRNHLHDSTSLIVAWSGWYPDDFHQRAFSLEGQTKSEFSRLLLSHLDTEFRPGHSLARPTLEIYCLDNSGIVTSRFLVRNAIGEKASTSIDPVVQIAATGAPIKLEELEALNWRPGSGDHRVLWDLELVLKNKGSAAEQ